MKDNELRKLLQESTEDVMLNTEENPTDATEETADNSILSQATEVMNTYQCANKWLDIIKEAILMDHGCVFFSDYIHKLAHTMPVRFDAFGDILHTLDMKVPYPATGYIPEEPTSLEDCFDKVFSTLNSILSSLEEFIAVAPRSAGISAETLLSDLSTEYTHIYRMKRALINAGYDPIKFDKWVEVYVNNISSLA